MPMQLEPNWSKGFAGIDTNHKCKTMIIRVDSIETIDTRYKLCLDSNYTHESRMDEIHSSPR